MNRITDKDWKENGHPKVAAFTRVPDSTRTVTIVEALHGNQEALDWLLVCCPDLVEELYRIHTRQLEQGDRRRCEQLKASGAVFHSVKYVARVRSSIPNVISG